MKKRVPGSPGIRWVPASRTVWHEACWPWEGGPGFPGRPFGRVNPNRSSDFGLNPNRSLDFGERNRMRTEAGKMPECLIFPIRNGHGVSNDRFGLKWRRSFSCMVLCFLCCQWRLRKRFPTSCFYHDGISVMTEFCKFAFWKLPGFKNRNGWKDVFSNCSLACPCICCYPAMPMARPLLPGI